MGKIVRIFERTLHRILGRTSWQTHRPVRRFPVSWAMLLIIFTLLSAMFAATTAQAQKTPNSLLPGFAVTARKKDSYTRPDFRQRFKNYLVRTYGPLHLTKQIAGAAISQADDVPPDWGQGWAAYGDRFASSMGVSSVTGTAEFAFGEALGLDEKYYPCTCKGVWRRAGHALLSTITARAGEDGHRVFSIPAVTSPYAGNFTSLLWLPPRYGPMDAFRAGNYDLLEHFGTTAALEFLLPLLHKVRHH